ncbi:MAG TPA: hypothetical protein VFH89_00960 [Sphingomicrobium sp.]|nr:hypothetical protein [Sphingomicrobium sp.]
MSLKFNFLAATALFALSTAAGAQDTQPPTTTQTTTTQTQPTATPTPPTTTQTTTTQPTTTPEGQPATTTQTTTTETSPTVTPEGQPAATTTQTTTTETQVAAATADDFKKGVSVFDQSGALVGKIDSVKGDGAIVNTGKARAEIPLASFGKNDQGLVVATTKADIDTQAKPAKKPKS